MTREDVLRLLDELCGAYPQVNFKNPRATATIWQISFEKEDAQAVFMAARLHIGKSKYFPTPYDIKANLPYCNMMHHGPVLTGAVGDPDDPDGDQFIKDLIKILEED